MNTSTSRQFRFGLISDIQYGDFEDGMNLGQTEQRTYRQGLVHARSAVEFWNQQQPSPDFILQLGDFIDGQSNGTYGQGLELSTPQSQVAFDSLFQEFTPLKMPIYHCIGNHELYNFTYPQLKNLLSLPEQIYHSFSPHPKWRIIILNPYEISVMQKEGTSEHQEAFDLLSLNNPNYPPTKPVNFFDGLVGLNQRFVPFNGGFGKKQLKWLVNTVERAVEEKQSIIVASHLPLYQEASSPQNLAFDYDQAIEILHTYGQGKVKAYFAGHRHSGGYAQDQAGIHHLTVQAPLTHGLCFAYADVYSNQIQMHGQGQHRSYTFTF